MRVLGFSRKWSKLQNSEFTTFRFPRKDRDWHEGETVQIVYHPRQKDREVLGVAQIISKETKQCQMITEEEAIADGFRDVSEMMKFLGSFEQINKLTLRRYREV